jgi:hypothetical protein
MFELIKVANYDPLVLKNINETYDVVSCLCHEAYKASKNKHHPKLSNYSDPPLEEMLNLVFQTPRKNIVQLQKKLKPKRLYKVLNREPVAKELILPKKASQLMSILLKKDPDETEYKKVLIELNVMLGKSNETLKAGHSNRNNDIERLNPMLKVCYGTI